MSADARLSAHERDVIACVEQYGCFVLTVASAEDDEWEPPFTYSVGFTETVNQPEVIIFGLGSGLSASMVNETLRQCREGLVLSDWTPIDGLIEDFTCVARTVRPENIVREHFNSAMWYHQYRTGRPLAQAVQIVWPGAVQGLLPWDKGCNPLVLGDQPALYNEGMLH